MDLFDDLPPEAALTHIAPGAVLLHGFAREGDAALLQAIESVLQQVPSARAHRLALAGAATAELDVSVCAVVLYASRIRL